MFFMFANQYITNIEVVAKYYKYDAGTNTTIIYLVSLEDTLISLKKVWLFC
jgi:hypothetical protein